MKKQTFFKRFNFAPPAEYDQHSLQRLGRVKPSSLRPAAVLIGLIERRGQLHVLLTKRASHLKHHPGQVSFPGGKFESSDASLKQTAVRETVEEVGIDESLITIIGQLPALPTISQFSVTPYIALIDHNYIPKIDTNEVAEIFEVPASFLFRQKNLFDFHFQLKSSRHKVFAIPYQHHFIWGVTAQIVDALQRQLTQSNE
jgi:8-oxo-dGTP pyrophosphatase MutT (NUDIX family)